MSREIKFRVYDQTKCYYVAIRDNDCFDIRQAAQMGIVNAEQRLCRTVSGRTNARKK